MTAALEREIKLRFDSPECARSTVIEPPAISGPNGFGARAYGDPGTSAGKRLDVDLFGSGDVRHIRDPLAVRRNSRQGLVGRGVDQRPARRLAPVEWQDPDACIRRLRLKKDGSPVRRVLQHVNVGLAMPEFFRIGAPIGASLNDDALVVCSSGPGHALTVGRPRRSFVFAFRRADDLFHLPLQVEDPDVVTLGQKFGRDSIP